MKQEIVVVVVVFVETAKFDVCVKDINFFDFIMQVDFWNKFRISVNSANFLHHLIEIAVNYREKNIIKMLFRCLRDFALQWFKNQFKFISLNDFKTIITKNFSFSSISKINFDQTIIDFSSQKYHRCLECDVQFSSTSRFLTYTQKSCSKNFTCKYFEKTFASNNKFHEHVRLHYIKKIYNNKTLKQHFVEKENNYINSSILSFTLLITFISSITFKSVTTSIALIVSIVSIKFFYFMTASESTSAILKFSHHSIIMMNTSIVYSFTFSSTTSHSSIVSHRKSYFTMIDLFEMFVEKLNKKNMNITQKKSIFSCFSEFDQSR